MEVTMARRFTREEKLNHIAIWKASGLNRKDYATSKGIKEDTLYDKIDVLLLVNIYLVI